MAVPTTPSDSGRPRLDHAAEADVCILGDGFAELFLARELARRGWSVVLLAPGRLGDGIPEQATALAAAGFALPLQRLERRLGADRTAALFALSIEGLAHLREAVDELRLNEARLVPGLLRFARGADPATALRVESERISGTYGLNLIHWPRERVRAALASERPDAGVYDGTAFHLRTLPLHGGLAADAGRRGARLFEDSPVTGIDLRSIRRTVGTAAGQVRCDHVVVGAAAPPVLWPNGQGLLSVLRPAAVSVPLPAGAAMPFPGVAMEARAFAPFHHVTHDGRLAWQGGAMLREPGPRSLARLARRGLAATTAGGRGPAVEAAWVEAQAYARHAMPVLCEVRKGVFVMAGFGDHALPGAAMAGHLLAETLADRGRRLAAFERFGLSSGDPAGLRARWRLWRLRGFMTGTP